MSCQTAGIKWGLSNYIDLIFEIYLLGFMNNRQEVTWGMWTRSCRLTDESQENSGIRVKSDDQELTEVGQWRLHSLSSQETLSPWSQHLTTGGSTCNCRVVTGVSESSPLIGQYLCYWAVIGWCQETPARWCWSLPGVPGPDKGCCVQSWGNRFRALLRASGHLTWHEHPPCTTPV